MKILTRLEELDVKLIEADDALKISDERMRDVFSSFQMTYPAGMPEDPYSREYRDFQFKLYERISGKLYKTANERTLFDVESASSRPFPFYTGGAATVRDHLILVANLIGLLPLNQGAKILEFGPGWGNTTLFLAQMGFDVTAYDIEPNFVELIKRRAARHNISIDARVGGFLDAEKLTEKYDAVVFFECFHHCEDHLRLINALKPLVKPGGRIVFGAEPIHTNFPIPWGVRLDGEALWAIRNFGWLELGFNEGYFLGVLKRFGWRVKKHTSKEISWVNYYIATHCDDPVIELSGNDNRIRTTWGTPSDAGLAGKSGAGFFCYGPYIEMEAGDYIVTIELSVEMVSTLSIDIAEDAGNVIRLWAVPEINYNTHGDITLQRTFSLKKTVNNFELRITCAVSGKGIVVLKSYRICEVFDER